LAGNFGTGKTLAAYVAAKLAVDHGHTFIYCESIEEFSQVMEFARLYAEGGKIAIVFCEDIDKLLKGERSINMDQVLNILDGVDSKRHEIMSVFTTNDVEQVHQAAVRPGRIDAIIHVQRPDADAAIRLVRLYAGDRLPVDESLVEVGETLSGNIPAVIRECVERSKLYAIGLGEFEHLTSGAILASARTMKMQLELLEEKRDIKPSEMAVFGTHMGEQIAKAIKVGMVGYDLDKDCADPADQFKVVESVAGKLSDNHQRSKVGK
jgi:transitional endoplasmic reticulum ATPase